MAFLSGAMGEYQNAKAFWQSASDLKERFNRDWWDDEQGSIVLALDPDKRQVRAVTSNVGHCITCGIISDEHLPRVVGRMFSPDIEDMRRQMDVNYWGQVYGSRTAVQHLRRTGGALINVGSALSDRAIPLQGGYCAAKHALKAFTDALRMELEEEGLPIAVTLVKPASIDTPFFEKARTYLGVEPQPVPPVYAPEVVSEVILHAAEHPLRELIAGGSGAKLSAARFAPRLADLYMERWTFDSQGTDKPVNGRRTTSTIRCRRTEASEGEIGKGGPARAVCIHAPHCIHVRQLRSSRQWRSASRLS